MSNCFCYDCQVERYKKFIIWNEENNTMATRLIKKSELERLFPNPIQRDAFLDIMKGIIAVEKPIDDRCDGLPIGFTFPYDRREEWTNCCDALYNQGFKIIKA